MLQPPPTTRGMRQVEERIGQSIHIYLMDAYLVRQRSMVQIAAELGVDKATVSRWMARYGIKPRYVGYAGRGRVA